MRPATVNVLPLWQPWATLAAIGAKCVETRHWPTPHRLIGERIAIYATKGGLTKSEERELLSDINFHTALRGLVRSDRDGTIATVKQISDVLPRGALVATAVIDRCTQITIRSRIDLEERHPDEYAFGNYEPGRYAWVLRDVEKLDEPIRWRSEEEDGWKPGQGIFRIPAEVVGLAPPQETLPLGGAS